MLRSGREERERERALQRLWTDLVLLSYLFLLSCATNMLNGEGVEIALGQIGAERR